MDFCDFPLSVVVSRDSWQAIYNMGYSRLIKNAGFKAPGICLNAIDLLRMFQTNAFEFQIKGNDGSLKIDELHPAQELMVFCK